MENPIKMDDLGVPLFLETPLYSVHSMCFALQLTSNELPLQKAPAARTTSRSSALVIRGCPLLLRVARGQGQPSTSQASRPGLRIWMFVKPLQGFVKNSKFGILPRKLTLPLKIGHPKRKLVFKPFSGAMLVSGTTWRVTSSVHIGCFGNWEARVCKRVLLGAGPQHAASMIVTYRQDHHKTPASIKRDTWICYMNMHGLTFTNLYIYIYPNYINIKIEFSQILNSPGPKSQVMAPKSCNLQLARKVTTATNDHPSRYAFTVSPAAFHRCFATLACHWLGKPPKKQKTTATYRKDTSLILVVAK